MSSSQRPALDVAVPAEFVVLYQKNLCFFRPWAILRVSLIRKRNPKQTAVHNHSKEPHELVLRRSRTTTRPVTDAELEDLVRAGTILSDTLIWREGMANWQPYGQVKGVATPPPAAAPMPEDAVVCSSCGKLFGRDDVIRYGDLWVCAACKPTFVQRIKEGAALPGVVEYAGFWIRFVAKFVDGLILRFVGTFIGLAGGAALAGLSKSNPMAALVLLYGTGFIVDMLYRTIFVGAYGATPGKMAVKARVVNADGSKVSYAKAFARSLAEYLSIVTLFIGYILAAFDSEKRALHDRVCGTRVIKKMS